MNNKYNITIAKQIFLSKNLKLLEKEYINTETKMKCKCLNCYKIIKTCLYNVKIGKGCKSCSIAKANEIRKFSLKQVKDLFLQQNCIFLDRYGNYKNVNTPLLYICSCGNKAKISISNFKKGHRCLECSRQKRARHGKQHKGWNPNRSKDLRGRDSKEAKTWAKSVLKRDNWTCKACNKKGSYLEAHHIQNFSSHKELRFDIDNGATLCKDCHRKFHLKFGNTGNNLRQLTLLIQRPRFFLVLRNRKRKLPEGII